MRKTKNIRRVPPTGQTAFKDVKTSSNKSDALKVAEFQIAASITCHSAVHSIEHLGLGGNMVAHGKGSNFVI